MGSHREMLNLSHLLFIVSCPTLTPSPQPLPCCSPTVPLQASERSLHPLLQSGKAIHSIPSRAEKLRSSVGKTAGKETVISMTVTRTSAETL